jgi:hypothetical protein
MLPQTNYEDHLTEVLADISGLILASIRVDPGGISFRKLARLFGTDEAVIHKCVYALGCGVDEDACGFVVLTAATFSPIEAAKRFIQGKEL